MTCLHVYEFVVDRRREAQSRPPLAETMFMTGKTGFGGARSGLSFWAGRFGVGVLLMCMISNILEVHCLGHCKISLLPVSVHTCGSDLALCSNLSISKFC